MSKTSIKNDNKLSAVIKSSGRELPFGAFTTTDLRILANTLDTMNRNGSATVVGTLDYLTQDDAQVTLTLGYDKDHKHYLILPSS